MGAKTNIAWADATFNPWRGCEHATAAGSPHPGCEHCYAESMSKRNPAVLGEWGANGTRVVASEAMWSKPLEWNAKAAKDRRPIRVFCGSLCDTFEDWQGPMMRSGVHLGKGWRASCGPHDRLTMRDVLGRLFNLIDDTPNLIWMLLTKRPENVARMWNELVDIPYIHNASSVINFNPKHRANVWIGTSVSNQETYDALAKPLTNNDVLCSKLFLSAEPLLGPIRFREQDGDDGPFSRIDWVIVGGESGPGARPMEPDWAREIHAQCVDEDLPFFMKQMGGTGNKRDKLDDMPDDLRIQEIPE